ncbi:hypothetical protein R1sor_009224 [Riccia sorocarpa]|uniref:SWIM-type domain-containing protein n=1 Tax=Riccia sorocarpa TaxID=122646 RepID=A0ABD3H8F1_9MARC
MDNWVQLSDPGFKNIQLLTLEADGTSPVSVNFCSVRWKLDPSSVYVCQRTEIFEREAMILVEEAAVGIYKLKRGLTYVVFGNAAESAAGTPGKRSLQEDGSSRTPSKRIWDGIQNDPNYVSAYEACLRIEGISELSKLYLASFEHRVVDHLPEDYDGNVIFELPPSTQADLSRKGGGLVGMDRAHDCWLWTKSVTTSAQTGGKKSLYAVNKIRCVGSLKCVNDCCPYFISEGQASRIDWPDKMFYVIPKGKVDIDEVEKMSRVAIHVGNHTHPPRRICSRRNFNNVKEVVAETLHASPHFTPGQVCAAASQVLFQRMIDDLGAEGLTKEENYDLLDSLSNVACPDTFTNLIRSIRKYSKEPREESDIIGPFRSEVALPSVDAADTHRHDRVAVTVPVVRRAKSRPSFDFLAPSTSMPTPTVTGPSLPTTDFTPLDPQPIALSSDMSEPEPHTIIAEDSQAVPEAMAAEVQSPATQPSAEPQPTITTLSSDDDFGGNQPRANANQPYPQNTVVPPIPCGNRRTPAQTRGTDHGEPEVLITGVRLRTRPPTRASTTTHSPGEVRITQHRQLIVEQDVDRRFWHISCLQLNGNPTCSANITGPNPPRALCKTKIKSAGLKKPGFGIVAPSFVGYRRFNSIERPHQFWFCPETSCVGSRRSQDCRFQMPTVPDVMPILTGTNLSQVEVDFLTAKGFTLVHRFPEVAIPRTRTPTVVDIKINVDAYPQKIDAVPSSFRFNSRGTKGCRRKSTPSGECNDRLERAITTTMLRTETWVISEGNGYGKRYKICTHVQSAEPNHYIVQICYFPCCSCDDFFQRETRRNTFVPCKHMYWVYLNIFGLSLNEVFIHQPVFTRDELDKLLSMEHLTPEERRSVSFG